MTYKKYIKEGENFPFGYGFTRVCWERYNQVEVMIMPINFIYRGYWKLLAKYHLFDWEKEVIKKQREFYQDGYYKGQIDKFKEIYNREERDWNLMLPHILKKKKNRKILKEWLGRFEDDTK